MVQQLIKDGNLRDRTLRLSPAGLMHRTVWRLDLMLEIKKDHRDSGLSTFLALIAWGLILFMISSISYFFLNRLGTSPVFSMLLMLSKKSSRIIWVSKKRKQTFSISTPASKDILCRSPLKDSLLYPFPISNIWVLHRLIKEAIFDKDCLPLPPTPINIALPRGCTNILEILRICKIASLKKTSSNFPFVSTLYSYILDSKNYRILFISSTCSYITSSVSAVMAVVNTTPSYLPFTLSRSTPSPNLLLTPVTVVMNHYLSC